MAVRRRSGLTLALSGEAAVASANPAGNTIDEHQGKPASGLVRFNASLGPPHNLAKGYCQLILTVTMIPVQTGLPSNVEGSKRHRRSHSPSLGSRPVEAGRSDHDAFNLALGADHKLEDRHSSTELDSVGEVLWDQWGCNLAGLGHLSTYSKPLQRSHLLAQGEYSEETQSGLECLPED